MLKYLLDLVLFAAPCQARTSTCVPHQKVVLAKRYSQHDSDCMQFQLDIIIVMAGR